MILKGQITEFVYDRQGRVQDKKLYENQMALDSQSPNEIISFAYDQLGRQNQIFENRGTTTLTYDSHGRLNAVTSPEGAISYEYDPITGRKERTLTANSETFYNYDELGRLKTVTVNKQNGNVLTTPQITTYTYNEVGNRSAITHPNNTRTEYQYDSLNRLTEMVNRDLNVGGASSPRLLSSYQYQLAPNGRRIGVTETRLEKNNTYSSTGITYTYDTLNRLIQEASGSTLPEANLNTTYTYDLVGNRLEKSCNVGANSGSRVEQFTYFYNANDLLLTEDQNLDGDFQSATYDYDANGSLINKIVTPEPRTLNLEPATYNYTYNLENRLSVAQITRIENGNTLDISTAYEYNQSGIRVSADSSITNHTTNAIFENKKTFLIDANNHTGYPQVLEQFEDLSGTPSISYTIGNDVISQATSAGTDVLMYDGHGSTRLLIDKSGNITDRYSYDAYGIMLGGNPTPSAKPATSLLYSGEQFDVNLQQQYLRARYYDQDSGRFNRLDPFIGNNSDPQSLHKYAYAHGDPINGIDPSGFNNFSLISVLATGGIGLLIGAIVGGVVGAKLGGVHGAVIGAAIGAFSGAAIGLTIGRIPAVNAKILGFLVRGFGQAERVFRASPMLTYLWTKLLEKIPPQTIETFRVSLSRLQFLQSQSRIILGRFYHGTPLQDFAAKFNLNAQALSGEIGIGQVLIRNIQGMISNAQTIFIRAQGAIDPLSFTFKHEIKFILGRPGLWNRVTVINELGVPISFVQWASNNGLI